MFGSLSLSHVSFVLVFGDRSFVQGPQQRPEIQYHYSLSCRCCKFHFNSLHYLLLMSDDNMEYVEVFSTFVLFD